MAIKIIKYTPKQTLAKTQYVEISTDDFGYITQQLIQVAARILELDTTRDEDWRLIKDQYFHRRRKDLPKGKLGENTPASFIGGLINNLVFGTQRDFTEHQINAIETIFGALNQIYDDINSIRFQVSIV
jgi:hypothetical protein